jgi:hypothetical protein
LRLKMKRSAAGVWSLDAGLPGGILNNQFIVTDNTYDGGQQYFGVLCLYTATRKDKYFFDNLNIVPDAPDTQAPLAQQLAVLSAQTLQLTFNEPLDSASAVLPVQYSISGGINVTAAAISSDRRAVTLSLNPALNTGTYTLTLSGIEDEAGNAMAPQNIDFEYVNIGLPENYDILINEIMADPDPSVGLPLAEWIELYNRSGKIINLNTLRIDDGGSAAPLPDFLLKPDSLVVLTTPAAVPLLKAIHPRVFGVSGFPSLNNDGDVLTLSAGAKIIDQVSYALDWHSSLDKKAGGWSLERINPGTPCLGRENWTSCPAIPGGSLAARNFAYADTPDETAPHLQLVYPLSATTLLLTFSEVLDEASAENATYTLTPAIPVVSAIQNTADRTQITLVLGAPMQAGKTYEVQAAADVQDCSGNALEPGAPQLTGLPQTPAAGDVIINEILCNPVSGGARFVEVYNRSQKIIAWQQMYLANFMDGSDVVSIEKQRLIFPGDYQVFTINPDDIYQRFEAVSVRNLLFLAGPGFDDDAGNLTLYWTNGLQRVTLDSVVYSDDWHNALFSVSEREGVSLERIRIEGATNDPANWTSSAARQGNVAGTPTRKNSQELAFGAPSEAVIGLSAERLSPDDDGYEDFLDIQYRLKESGYAANVVIYDSEGLVVRRMARQALAGTEGALRWDGDTDEGTRARPGIYILWVELYHPAGQVQRIKKTFSLVKRF